MNMLLVGMRRDRESMLSLGKAHRKFIAGSVRFLRCDLSRFKGLPDLVGYHISLPGSSGFLIVLRLREKEFHHSCSRIALVR